MEFEAKTVCILGRQPELGLAELESLYGAEHILPLKGAALLDIDAGEINFQRLGGTIKVARLLTILPTTNWQEILAYLTDKVPVHLQYLPDGPFTLGLSTYNLDVSVNNINRGLLVLKKVIRKSTSRSVRVVPNKTPALNSAQVLHNKLTRTGAWELLLIANEQQAILAQTFFVQDIEAYATRDQARPKRDARVGMLPPKLAQIIINLAVGQASRSEIADRKSQIIDGKAERSLSTNYDLRPTILDPFCGTGVILQEALLMGYDVMGSDINPRMVEYAKTNLDWLKSKFEIRNSKFEIFQADATSFKWPPPIDTVASETYLGRPLSSLPDEASLQKIVQDVNTILKKFLRNLHPQLPKAARLCLAVPAWRNPEGRTLRRLPLIDHLTELGYNRVSFVHVSNDDLLYFRPDQIVARELLVLKKA